MTKHKHLLPGLAIVAAGIVAFSAPASAADQLIVVERAASDTVTDLGAKGDSVGDVLTFANDIGWCVRTVAGQSWECFWTTLLDKGQITVEGPYYDNKDSVLAITGGTGAYASARGEMKLHARDDKGTEYDFAFTVVDVQSQ
jgi:hypothetical protein